MKQDIVSSFPNGIPIVCDASSNFCSRAMDISKYACVFAGAQKNVGPSGVVIVIIRKDLLERKRKLICPLMFDYKVFFETRSCYNTPPTFNIYVTGLIFKHLLSIGMENISNTNIKKSQMVYNVIKKYPSVFSCPVNEAYRSRMNIPFRILDASGRPSNEKEKMFLNGADQRKMVGLAGHRSVGGIRVSLYNAMDLEGVQLLIAYMEEFAKS